MTTVRTEAVNVSLDSQGKSVSVAAADLSYFIKNVLNASGLINDHLTTEHPVAKAELTLSIVSECV